MDLHYETKEPLYARIINRLLSDISSGILKVNDRLPTEDELQQEFGVSRGTVRRALSELESMGLITRRPALGTFVTATIPRLPKGLGTISSFTQQLRDADYEPQTKVLDANLIQASHASERVLEAFDVREDAQVVQIRRLRLGNDEPFAVQSVYLLPEEFPGILEGMDLLSLFKVYERYGRTVVNADEWLRARGAASCESEVLHIAIGEPVVVRDRISYDQDGKPFEVLHSVDRGDRFVYRYQLVNDRSGVASATAGDPPEG